jgi:tryptophan synthase alpha chain
MSAVDSKIKRVFSEKKNLLSIYFTAGYPALHDTVPIIHQLEKSGVDMIEIGIPFSDPLADGPAIQYSSQVALENGMTIKLLFEQLKELGNCNVPLTLMGYLNPTLQYGIEKFCREAAGIGISGLIIPDLPLREYLDEYKEIFDRYGLKNIFLITPQTNEKRIRLIDKHSEGFIYMVAASSTTGEKSGITTEQVDYFERIMAMHLENPLLAGFGISDERSFLKVCEYANGAIIGSAFIRALSAPGTLEDKIVDFVRTINTGKILQQINK